MRPSRNRDRRCRRDPTPRTLSWTLLKRPRTLLGKERGFAQHDPGDHPVGEPRLSRGAGGAGGRSASMSQLPGAIAGFSVPARFSFAPGPLGQGADFLLSSPRPFLARILAVRRRVLDFGVQLGADEHGEADT